MTKIKILFIDDDTSLQILAPAMMNTGAFEVLSATRTAEADKILASQKVDMIVCDVMMPDEDGLAYCGRLRQGGNKIPILMLSAVSNPETMKQAATAGATDYLVKPFDIHALQKKVVAMLGKHAGQKPAPTNTPQKPTGLFGWLRR